MATKIVHGHTCDDCERAHIYDVVAEQHHVISIDGGPYKRFDFCSPSERLVMGHILQLYQEGGEDLEQAQQASHSDGLQAAPEERQITEEALPVPAARKRPPKKNAKALPSKAANPAAEGAPMQVWCTRPHGQAGAGKFVSYKSRVSHAETHDGANIWDIIWKDVHGILKTPCTTHQECLDVGLTFLNQQGVYTHISKCPLPRIDSGVSQHKNEAPGEQPDRP